MQERFSGAVERAQEHFAAEFAICDRAAAYMWDTTWPWKGRALDGDRGEDALIAVFFARTFNSFCAAIELCRLGLAEQAAMLNRSLFEDMVDAHWITLDPDRAVELINDHQRHGQMLIADAADRQLAFLDEEALPAFDPSDRPRLDKLFGRYGERSWTTRSLFERVKAIEHLWDDEERASGLWFHHDIVHAFNNRMLHPSGVGLAGMVRSFDQRGFSVKMGPQGELIGEALTAALWCAMHTF